MTPRQPSLPPNAKPRHGALAGWSALAGLLLWGGCLAVPARAASSAQSEVKQGSVQVIATLSPAEAALCDTLTLTLRLECATGVSVPRVDLHGLEEQFALRETRQSLPRSEGSHYVVEHRIVLEPRQLGRLSLDPLAISFHDRRDGRDELQVLHTGPIPYTITTSIDSDELSLAQSHHAATAGEILDDSLSELPWLLAMAAALSGIGLLLWRRGRLRRLRANPGPSPEQLAEAELERLLGDDLAEDDVKRFYAELTDIVRRYLERRFETRTRPQTSEEFLQAMGQTSGFSSEQTILLQAFLTTADRIKFANAQPTVDELEESLAQVRVLLGQRTEEVAI